MPVYNHPSNRALSNIDDADKLNNQIVLNGLNQTFDVPNGVFFLEYLEAATGTTVTISDGNGAVMTGAIAAYNNDHSPLRCDYGITITGNAVIAKGFFLRGVYNA